MSTTTSQTEDPKGTQTAPAKPTPSAPAPSQPAGPAYPKSVVLPQAANREQWIVNEDNRQATVQIVNLRTGVADEMFVMPMGRAEIPKGFAFDRATLIKFPRVRLVTR